MYAADAKKCIDLGKLLKDFLTVSFSKTTGYDYRLKLVILLEPCNIENVVYRLTLSTLNKAASIYDNYVRLGLLGGYFISRRSYFAEHYLCIYLIFRTTK